MIKWRLQTLLAEVREKISFLRDYAYVFFIFLLIHAFYHHVFPFRKLTSYSIIRWTIIFSILVCLPLLGVVLAGISIVEYLEFPPITRYVEHAPFSWPVFLGFAFFLSVIILPFLFKILKKKSLGQIALREEGGFPWWGWFGLGIVTLYWILAWTRFSWFWPLQNFTFTPLWLGYIVVVNAWTSMRTGRCLLVNHTRFLLSLFLLSAVFWWFYEYLNRFVQNWYYLRTNEFGPLEYFLRATMPFSTVLPAVLSTNELLKSFPHLEERFKNLWTFKITHPKRVGWFVLLMSGAGLMGLGVWPDILFPLMWVSPLLLITSLEAIFGEKTVFTNLKVGDWRELWIPAIAGVICGFFLEMWNMGSYLRWEYTLPYVNRFKIFEMPILGYGGYLPFGVECVVIVGFILRNPTRVLEK